MVESVKWVNEVIKDAPYDINEDFMKKLFNEYNIDYIIHGDDPCLLPDGSDAYALAKAAGRYKQIKRTEGVSSTDIVGKRLIFRLLVEPTRVWFFYEDVAVPFFVGFTFWCPSAAVAVFSRFCF